MEKDLKIIKAKYGEQMMRLCRTLFPRILDIEGLLPQLLEKNFCKSRVLASDIINQGKESEFKAFIYAKLDSNNEKEQSKEKSRDKSAVELMAKVGYVLYPECKTEADIQSFRHYYKRTDGRTTPIYEPGYQPESSNGEELCTFRGDRLNTCRVWFAVHKDAEVLKREDFIQPDRNDRYNKSVISIQFSKDKASTLSIKSRYNHTVNNPDNLFNSNLDNIIPGLTEAFARDFGAKENLKRQVNDLELENYIRANDGKYYRYNIEINNIYYCPNNIIIDNYNVLKLPNHQILADSYIIDGKEKTVRAYDCNNEDPFPVELSKFEKISFGQDGSVYIQKQDGGKAVIKINQKNQIIEYADNSIKNCKSKFMSHNTSLKKISMENVLRCGDEFLYQNRVLEEINLPNLEEVGSFFLNCNEQLTVVDLPHLKKCKDAFMFSNRIAKYLNLKKLERCGDFFMCSNEEVTNFNAENLQECGDDFFVCNNKIKSFRAEKLRKCGNRFMRYGLKLNTFDVPNLQERGNYFLGEN